jgi:hypothetical protein
MMMMRKEDESWVGGQWALGRPHDASAVLLRGQRNKTLGAERVEAL